MAFTLEDGTGITGANSYVSSDEYKDYLKDRGRATSLGGSAINAALIVATDYVETRWLFKLQHRHPYNPLSEDQGLSLPTDDFEVDALLKGAIILYAEHNTTEGQSLFGTQSEQGPVMMERSKVGPIEEQTQYDTTKATTGSRYQKVPQADALMARYLRMIGLGSSKQVIRN